MSDHIVDRRQFLALLGAGSAAVVSAASTARLIALTTGGELVESEQEYGGFLVERATAGRKVYEYDAAVLQRMSEKLTVFSRNRWDPERQDRPERREDRFKARFLDGKGTIANDTRLDHALIAGSWATAAMGGGNAYQWTAQTSRTRAMEALGKWDPAGLGLTWEDMRRVVKHASLFYGASMAGVAEVNPLWLYASHYTPAREDPERVIPIVYGGDRFEQAEDAWYIPAAMNRVIVLAFEEDFYAIANSPGALASAATGNGYSRMANTAYFVAEFVRALGYRALPAGNGVALSVPMAIDAGLGQLGRMGLLVTPKYGPRVRLAKVLTDMPLETDAPIDFGVTEFCDRCKLCATECPTGAVTEGSRTWKGNSKSNNPGTLKWYATVERCYDYNGFSCSTCKRVCPFNKPNNSWLHQMTRGLVLGRVRPANAVMTRLDQASGYGSQVPDSEFWKMDGNRSIAARDAT
jgi:epoxyqueuosine reductase